VTADDVIRQPPHALSIATRGKNTGRFRHGYGWTRRG
jgi:hypothetical protein